MQVRVNPGRVGSARSEKRDRPSRQVKLHRAAMAFLKIGPSSFIPLFQKVIRVQLNADDTLLMTLTSHDHNTDAAMTVASGRKGRKKCAVPKES